MQFENKVKHYMDLTGLPIHRIAMLSGLPNTTVYDLYKGNSKIENVSYITLYRLAKCLKTHPSRLCRKVKEKK